MDVKVQAVEHEGAGRSLVFGVDEDGRRVSFSVPRYVGDRLRARIAAGQDVVAQIPLKRRES